MNHLEIIQEVFGKDEYVNDVWLDNMLTLCRRVAEEEREACAVIAFNAKTYIKAAEAIRARGQS